MKVRKLLIATAPALACVTSILFLGQVLMEKSRGTDTEQINWPAITLFSVIGGSVAGGALMLQRFEFEFDRIEQDLRQQAQAEVQPEESEDDLGDIFDISAAPIETAQPSSGSSGPAAVVQFPDLSDESLSPPPPPLKHQAQVQQVG